MPFTWKHDIIAGTISWKEATLAEAVRVWMEISLNIAYLIVVWGLVIVMARRQDAEALAQDPG